MVGQQHGAAVGQVLALLVVVIERELMRAAVFVLVLGEAGADLVLDQQEEVLALADEVGALAGSAVAGADLVPGDQRMEAKS